MKVEQNVKQYIEDHHFNRSSLAKAIGLSPSTLHAVFAGKRKLGADEFVDICNEMGADINRVIYYDQEKEMEPDEEAVV